MIIPFKEEQIARFAKALGHPARVRYPAFSGKAGGLLFWGDT